MAKRPTTPKPAAATPPAPQSQGAPAASAAGEPAAGPPASEDRSASAGIQSPAPGEAAAEPHAAAASNDAAPVNLAEVPAGEIAPAGQGEQLAVAIKAFSSAASALALAAVDLTEAALAGPPGSAQRALDAVAEAHRSTVGAGLNFAALEIQARDERGAEDGELEALEVRSRDGKPFRRAGLALGDRYQLVHATADQAKALRADRKGVQIKGEN